MQALGFIETKGFVAATEAADSALKAANVSLIGQRWPGSGLVTIIITGDVAAVKAAVEAGTESASAIGQVVSAQIIASPHQGMESVVGGGFEKKKPDTNSEEKKTTETPSPKKGKPGI